MGRKSNEQKALEAAMAEQPASAFMDDDATEEAAHPKGFKLVKMTNGKIVADVHPDEVSNYRAGGYYEA